MAAGKRKSPLLRTWKDNGMENDFDCVVSFDKNVNFWILRANGGKYLDDFIDDNYIGIQYNKVFVADLMDLDHNRITSVESVKDLYIEKYEFATGYKNDHELNTSQRQRLTTHAKQAYLFTFEMKPGDIVLVPSKKSRKFAVGIIEGEPYDESKDYIQSRFANSKPNGKQFLISNYIKRRHVTWHSFLLRSELPAFLSWIINSHHALTKIDCQTDDKRIQLFSLLTPLFQYNGRTYLKLHTGKGGDLSISDWREITECTNDIDKISMKADVHSPGFFTFVVSNIDINALSKFVANIFGLDPAPVSLAGVLSLVAILFYGGKDVFLHGVLGVHLQHQEQKINNERARLALKEQKDSYKTKPLAEKLEIQFTANGTAIENGRNTGEETDGPVAHSEKAK